MPKARFHLNLHYTANLTLEQAILIYRSRGTRESRCFASVHRIVLENGAPIIQGGKPVTQGAVRRLSGDLSASSSHVGYLPGNVLYADGDSLVWWVPPRRRHIAFRCVETALRERSCIVPHPALVFMVAGGSWLVWAHKGKKRPLPESPMWRAPYFNVSADGAICRGNVVPPTGATWDRIAEWEDAFFRSYFTHPNVSKGLVNHPDGAYAFWTEMLELPPAAFPQRALVRAGATLGELVERHLYGVQ
ncbi:MAG TPA: PRTRC system protein B [Pseudoduganella sp.]